MANSDDALRSLFESFQSSSGGDFTFAVTSTKELGAKLGLDLGRSPNPVYEFGIGGKLATPPMKFVAYTLTLNGNTRPATRAEALGRGLAAGEGKLFESNPFLLVYDYVGERLLAVPAVELFGAFAEQAAKTSIPVSESSTFSLSPGFQHKTISMYATLQTPKVWFTSTKPADLTLQHLIGFLRQVAATQAAKVGEVPAIVAAIKARLTATPAVAPANGPAAASSSRSEASLATIDASDESVRVDDRLWRMITNAIAVGPAAILVGPPGTGKSALVRKAVGALSIRRLAEAGVGIEEPLWATPDESWTARELIGGETIVDGEIAFRPGWVLRAIEEGRWLVLDEANRGDLDRIFGALLTWLAGGKVALGVESTAADAKVIELGWTSGPSRVEKTEGVPGQRRGTIQYLAGDDWRLIGTYNALDAQRVFKFGAALGRRFIRVPVPVIGVDLFTRALDGVASDLSASVRQKIASLYSCHFESDESKLGPALFLAMCKYLREAKAQAGAGGSPTEDDEKAAVQNFEAAITEAYVLSVGTYLAQLEEPDLDRLFQRIGVARALSDGEAEWVKTMVRALA